MTRSWRKDVFARGLHDDGEETAARRLTLGEVKDEAHATAVGWYMHSYKNRTVAELAALLRELLAEAESKGFSRGVNAERARVARLLGLGEFV